MKINFNQPFIGYDGNPTSINGKTQLIKDLLAQVLFSGSWIGEKDNKVELMLVSYDLSQRIYKSTGEVDITVEEAALIKEAAGKSIASAGGYAQVVHLIEG